MPVHGQHSVEADLPEPVELIVLLVGPRVPHRRFLGSGGVGDGVDVGDVGKADTCLDLGDETVHLGVGLVVGALELNKVIGDGECVGHPGRLPRRSDGCAVAGPVKILLGFCAEYIAPKYSTPILFVVSETPNEGDPVNTTAAATTAGVTIPTVRMWARTGVIAAVKTAGRWVIDETSLRYRIALAALKTRKATVKPIVYSVETMTAIGGSRWTKAGKDRVYINNWAEFAGLETAHYGTGNIASATYRGETVSNRQAGLIAGALNKVWFDTADGKLHSTCGYSNPRIGREQVWDDVVTGIRAAIAAL